MLYLNADVTDPDAVNAAADAARRQFGKVTALIHGAGVLADKRLADLSDDQFRAVYDTKVRGLANLLTALEGESLKAIALFSSTTARVGRSGQAAYAAANETLNKTARREARRRVGCRVVAVNWGPWEGGMVTPGLAKVFAQEGVGLIPLAAGGGFLLRELAERDGEAEVVVLAKAAGGHAVLGLTSEGEIVMPATSASGTLLDRTPDPGQATPAPGASWFGLDLLPVGDRTVRLADHAVLRSHVIDGRAVLPLALHVEWLAHAALHGNPGLAFHGFDELRVLQGVHADEDRPAKLRLFAGRAAKREGLFVVNAELRGEKGSKEVVHSRAEIVLADRMPVARPPASPLDVGEYPVPLAQIYGKVLFHGPALHAIAAVEGYSENAIVVRCRTAPPPGTWLAEPPRGTWQADPLVLDGVFQALILWSHAAHGSGSLPCYVGRYRQYRRSYPAAGEVRLSVRITRDGGAVARADVDIADADGRLIARLNDAECVIDRSLNAAFQRNRLPEPVGR